jgi:hypothetical protein
MLVCPHRTAVVTKQSLACLPTFWPVVRILQSVTVYDGIVVDVDPNPEQSMRLTVNGMQREPSDFEIHSVYVWNTELSPAQMKHVTSALRAQIGGTPDIANNELGPAVAQMTPSETAYEQVCPAGKDIDTANGDCTTSSNCAVCPAGTYRDAATGDCAQCPINTYNGITVSCDPSSCVLCDANSASLAGSGDISDCKCVAGYARASMYANASNGVG